MDGECVGSGHGHEDGSGASLKSEMGSELEAHMDTECVGGGHGHKAGSGAWLKSELWSELEPHMDTECVTEVDTDLGMVVERG